MDFTSLSPEELEHFSEVLEDPLKFAESFIIDPITLTPYKPNYVQREINKKKKRHLVIRVHRRGGKSDYLCILAIHASTINRSYITLVVCPDQDKVANIFNRIRELVNASPLLAGLITQDSRNPETITFSNGARIVGKTTGASNAVKGRGLRSKAADLILADEVAYFAEADFAGLDPIMRGDALRQGKVRTVAASTPTVEQNTFFQWCTNKELEEKWDRVHIPITENPEWSTAQVEEIRSDPTMNELRWQTEYLVTFPDLGENLVPEVQITAARQDISYAPIEKRAGHLRAFGVDWDNTSEAGINIVVIDFNPQTLKFVLTYRQEIPRGDQAYTTAVNRIIDLNYRMQPDFIYVDKGGGSMQVETLKLHGVRNPQTGLADKVVSVHFSENVTIYDPKTGQKIEKNAKMLMISYLLKTLEDRAFVFPDKDEQFIYQLRTYKIVGATKHGFKTNSKDEHIIDAVMLACLAIFQNAANPFRARPATQAYSMQAPQSVPTQITLVRERAFFRKMGTAILSRETNRGWARGTIGAAGYKREKV